MGKGIAPAGQPMAGAILTVGIRLLTGLGKLGVAPMPAVGSSTAVSPQAASSAAPLTISMLAVTRAVW